MSHGFSHMMNLPLKLCLLIKRGKKHICIHAHILNSARIILYPTLYSSVKKQEICLEQLHPQVEGMIKCQ